MIKVLHKYLLIHSLLHNSYRKLVTLHFTEEIRKIKSDNTFLCGFLLPLISSKLISCSCTCTDTNLHQGMVCLEEFNVSNL